MAGDWYISVSKDREVLSDWIRTLCDELEIDKPVQAFLVLQETLHAIRDFLPLDRAIILSDMLPFIIRCVYFAGWAPGAAAQGSRNRSAFFERIEKRLGIGLPIPPTEAAIVVFTVLLRKIHKDEKQSSEIISFHDFLKNKVDA